MKAERFPCLTEDLISLFWCLAEGSQEILKRRDVGGNNDDYSFDLYLSRFTEHVRSSPSPRIHNSSHTLTSGLQISSLRNTGS